jgi:hypothetical protein
MAGAKSAAGHLLRYPGLSNRGHDAKLGIANADLNSSPLR